MLFGSHSSDLRSTQASRLAIIAVASTFALPSLASAQSISSTSVQNENIDTGDIVVTARRREESAQKVPVAITAISAKMLDERHITTGQDLQGQVPSLAVSPSGQSRDVESITIRGQGTNYTASPAVVTYLAEVPLVAGKVASLQGPPGQFLDLANIQVLRGPQGTLFGRNSTGGAVLLEPAKPTERYEGYFQIQGGNYEDKEIEAVINVPLSDRLQVRLAGRYVDRDGYTKDVETGTDYDDRHYYIGRLGVMWKPTDQIENYLLITGTRSRSNGTGNVVDAFNAPLLDAIYRSFGAPNGCADVNLGQGCSVLTDSAAAQNSRSPRRVALGPKPIYSKISGWSAIDQFKVALSDNITLRNIISYSELQVLSPFDGDGTPFGIYQSNIPGAGPTDNLRQFTEELQIQGNALNDHVQYTTGIYYEEVRTPGSGFVIAPAQTFLFPFAQASRYKTSARAIYAQGTYDFGGIVRALSGLKLTGGIRYTWDKARGFGSAVGFNDDGSVSSCTNGVAAAATTFEDCQIASRTKSDAPTWTVGLDYQVTNNLLTYAKVSRGYKTGGINLAAVNQSNLTFRPEYVKTYEAGIKSTFRFGNDVRLTLNGDVFKTDYEDIQIATGDFNPVTFGSGAAVFNAAAARIKGVEIEGTLRLFHDFELSGSYSHLSSKYIGFSILANNPQLDCSGAFQSGQVELSCIPFPYTPRDQFSVAGRYTMPFSEKVGEVVLSAVYAYTGATYQTATTLPTELPIAQAGGGEPGTLIKGYGLLNLSINWNRIMETPIDLSFFMTNATNKTYRVGNTGVFNSIGAQSSLYGEPRMYGFRMRYSF
ncbi:TonB-dependent receptor [Sphingobium estronivorans]|uniref:TonB-dependent receptor n=1 Tax=Sphingobium estronivorans TaxID=1577690 RepID=UPI00123C73E4|nr:TonB-dependent receptor [Sphingobium estronivorans]